MFVQDRDFRFVKLEDDCIPGITKGKLVIALDFDGVITNPSKIKAEYLSRFLGFTITEEQCSRKYCLEVLKMTKEDYEEASIKAYTEEPGKLPLEVGFLTNFLRMAALQNLQIFLLTSRYDHMIAHMESYLRHYNIKVAGIVNTQYGSKAEPLVKLGARVFVEDTSSKLKQVIEDSSSLNKRCHLILFRNSQNKNEKNPDSRITEVNGWDELFNLIHKEHQNFISI